MANSFIRGGVTPKWSSEIDPFPMAVTKKYFPNTKQLGDITKINGADIEPVDIICAGSPCFVAGTQVITNRGCIPIEDVVIGDLVLTHTNSWKMVCDTMKHISKDIYEVDVNGTERIKVTGNHPIYVRHKNKIWNNSKRSYENKLSNPEWIEVKDLQKYDFIGYPINQKSENHLNLTKEQCWLIGRYIADGYINNSQRNDRSKGQFNHKVIFCIGEGKEKEFEQHLITYHGCAKNDLTVTKYEVIDENFMNLCKMCGCGAINKTIPPIMQNLPIELLKELIYGYISCDGYYNSKNKLYSMSTISKKLAYDIQMAVHKCFRVPCNVYFAKKSNTCIIQGRIVNQHDSYQITFKDYLSKYSHSIIDNDIIWRPFRDKHKLNIIDIVYNLEVIDDHSYTANGILVHNCQDLSTAGKREGFGGERSSLFRDFVRITDEMLKATNREYPKFLVFENVCGLFSSNKGEDIKEVFNSFDKLNFVCDMNVFDAQYMGVPQRRKRIFAIWTNVDYILKMENNISFCIINQMFIELLVCMLNVKLKFYEKANKDSIWRNAKLSQVGFDSKLKLFRITNKSSFKKLLNSWSSKLNDNGDMLKLFNKVIKNNYEDVVDIAILLSMIEDLMIPMKDLYYNFYESAYYFDFIRKELTNYAQKGQKSNKLFSEFGDIYSWDAYFNRLSNERYLSLSDIAESVRSRREILSNTESLSRNIEESKSERQGITPEIEGSVRKSSYDLNNIGGGSAT